MDWLTSSATEQGRAILAGLVSPMDLADGYLDAISRHPYGSRIYARVTEDRAKTEAMAAHDRARAGLRRGLLDGVALSWKDNIDSANIGTEGGSRLLDGRIPTADAEMLAGASLQGLVCLGKTHMTELAFSGLGVNPGTATPPNSLDPGLCPGGSSSGAAVSVALGLAAAAIGSDTGGSIRLPAAWNNLVGFKPTSGALPMGGVLPLCTSFDIVGPIARTVEDCAEIMAVLARGKVADLRGAAARGLRLLVLGGLPYADAQEAPVQAFEEAVARLSAAGAVITHAEPPQAAQAMALGTPLYAAEALGLWRAQIEAAPDLMNPVTLTRFRSGAQMSAPEFVERWADLRRAQAAWAEAVSAFDAVILPTAPILPPDAARAEAEADYFTQQNMLSLRNTRIANVLGLPSVSVPTGRPACGIMLMGRAGQDRALLRVAAGVEAALKPSA
ncbi:amidase [Paracoccus sp. Z118]|uniref:amidase n=1 Tax=Paracoccus sp. Z118 TaxID=2851017 RepID=UPI001C2CC130|nr:amidase [Paracoccus sp. Z118]MBV0891064.1 amidase [Paracoccus sp. Z118]